MKLIYCILAFLLGFFSFAQDFKTFKNNVEEKLVYSDYKTVINLINEHKIQVNESQDTDLQILKIDALINLNLTEEAFQISQNLLKKKLSPEQKANIHVHRELIFELTGDLQKAKKEIENAEEIFKINPEIKPKNYTYFLIRKSSLHRISGDKKEAEILTEEAYTYAIENNDQKHLPVIEMLLAFSYRDKNPAFYLIHLKKALALHKNYRNKASIAAMYSGISSFYLNRENYALAEKYIDSGISVKTNINYINADLFYNKSQIAEIQNRDQDALQFYKKYADFQEKDTEERRKIKIKELDNQYEKKELENNVKTTKRNNLILTIASVTLGLLLFSLSVFYILLRKKNNEIQVQKINIAAQNDELEKNLQQKQFLVKELNHRVKNNLAVILSLVDFQRDESDEKYRDKLDQLYQRINTISIAHDLYSYSVNTSESSLIDVRDYISKVFETHKMSSNRQFDYENNTADFLLNVDKMLPIGLILNELITNSIKHAQADEQLKLKFNLEKKESEIIVKYSDNGSEFFENNNKNSLGLFIIEGMVKQIYGKLSRENSHYTIICPL